MTWIFSDSLNRAYESSRYSRVPAAESSAGTSSDGEPSSQSNGSRTRKVYWCSDRTTESSPLSQFGMTCEPLTADRGEDLLTWYREDFLARTSAAPAKVRACPVLAPAYGRKWHALSMKFNPDSCWWKTRPSLLDGGSMLSSPTLPRWGSMQNGELWQREMSMRRISGIAYGSLPTPVKYDVAGRGEGDNYRGLGWQARYNWSTDPNAPVVPHPTPHEKKLKRERKQALFGTPTVTNIPRSAAFRRTTPSMAEVVQAENAKTSWPTPTANDAEKRGLFNVDQPRNGLPARVRKMTKAQEWPTPMTNGLRGDSGAPPDLEQRIRGTVPTPTRNDSTSGSDARGRQGGPSLKQTVRNNGFDDVMRSIEDPDEAAMSYPTPTSGNGLRGGSGSPHWPGAWQAPGHPEYGELNPDWVEWLMAWPIGWSSILPMQIDDVERWLMMISNHQQPGAPGPWWREDPSEIDGPGKIPRTIDKNAPHRVERIAALGNGQVSLVVAAAFIELNHSRKP